jgi:hypothetical protein
MYSLLYDLLMKRNRAVYVGGFGNGRWCTEQVSDALANYYDNVAPFTFAEARAQERAVRTAAEGATVVTHSAGLLAVMSALASAYRMPATLRAFSPPIPTSAAGLVGRTVYKSVNMHLPKRGLHSLSDIPPVLGYDVSATAELACHPVANLKDLSNISGFNALDAVRATHRAGIRTSLCYTHGDEYFQPTVEAMMPVIREGVDVTALPGIHDELVVRPQELLFAYFQRTAHLAG